MKKSPYIISLKGAGSLAESAYEFKVDDSLFSSYPDSEILGADVRISSSLIESNGVYELVSKFNGSVVAQCDLCLERVTFPVDFSNLLIIKYSSVDELDSEIDIISLPEGVSEVDLSQYFYDLLYLSLPAQRKHSEGECDSEMIKILEQRSGRSDVDTPSPFDKLREIF